MAGSRFSSKNFSSRAIASPHHCAVHDVACSQHSVDLMPQTATGIDSNRTRVRDNT
jgi:hypothetical protein